MSTITEASAKQVFKVPIHAYDIATGECTTLDRYLNGQPMDADLWHNQMLAARRSEKRIAYSNSETESSTGFSP